MTPRTVARTFRVEPCVGDLCSFWDQRGIFLGGVPTSYLGFCQRSPFRLYVTYQVLDEPVSRTSELSFSTETGIPPDEDVRVIALWVDGRVMTLPRIVGVDDGLRIVQPLTGCEQR